MADVAPNTTVADFAPTHPITSENKIIIIMDAQSQTRFSSLELKARRGSLKTTDQMMQQNSKLVQMDSFTF